MENPMYTSQFSVFPNHFHQKHAKTTPFPSKRNLSNLLQKSQHVSCCTRGFLLKDWRIIDYRVTSPHEVWQAVPLTQQRIEMVLRQSLFLGSWKNNLWKSSDGCPPKKQNGWFRLVYLKDGEPVVFLFLVYKCFTLNDPPNFMSFTYFVGFIFWTSMFGFRIVFHWVDVFFVHNYWGKTRLDKILTDTGIFKTFGWPSKNEHFYTFLTLEEGGCHLQPVVLVGPLVPLSSDRGLVRITRSLSSPSSWTFVYVELWRRTFVPLKQRWLWWYSVG